MNPLSLVMDLSASLYLGLVGADRRPLASRVRPQGARGETAHGLLDECLREAGADVRDIASLCVGIGPGSFTGIRVCIAMAQGLAFAGRLPVHPFSSLAALVACQSASGLADGEPPATVIAAIAANAGRYFVSRPGPGGRSEALLGAGDLLALSAARTTLVVSGNFPDRERFAPAFAGVAFLEDCVDFPRLARLAMAGPAFPGGALRPNYLMASAAEEKRRPAGTGETPL